MADIPDNTDYTAKDFKALNLRLQKLARTVYPDWTSTAQANFGNVLLSLFAYIGDTLTFYQDNQAAELVWPTVTQRENAIILGKAFNYSLPSAVAATGTVRFSITSPIANTVILPEGTVLRTSSADAIRYRTLEYAEIPPGLTFVDVPAEQAVLVTGEGFNSVGSPSQLYITDKYPVIDGSFAVEAEDGTYIEVDSLLDSDPLTGNTIGETSQVFTYSVDSDGKGLIRFGNGTVGKIPVGFVSVEYKIGGGIEGNVSANLVNALDQQIFDDQSFAIKVSVTNPTAFSGGADEITVAEARVKAPKSLRILKRSVVESDFSNNAEAVPGVARALMVTADLGSGVQENTGILYVVAKGESLDSGNIAPAVASTTLLSTVHSYIETNAPPTLTFTFETRAAPLFPVDVTVIVYLRSGASTSIVGDAIRANLADYFSVMTSGGVQNELIDFGANIKDEDGTILAELPWSGVFNAIVDTTGVREVSAGTNGLLLNGLRKSVQLNVEEFPILGQVTIINGATGNQI